MLRDVFSKVILHDLAGVRRDFLMLLISPKRSRARSSYVRFVFASAQVLSGSCSICLEDLDSRASQISRSCRCDLRLDPGEEGPFNRASKKNA